MARIRPKVIEYSNHKDGWVFHNIKEGWFACTLEHIPNVLTFSELGCFYPFMVEAVDTETRKKKGLAAFKLKEIEDHYPKDMETDATQTQDP